MNKNEIIMNIQRLDKKNSLKKLDSFSVDALKTILKSLRNQNCKINYNDNKKNLISFIKKNI